MKLTEHDIQNTIIEYLQRKGYYVMRLNSGAVKTKSGGFMRMAKAGTPDLLAYKPAECDPAEWALKEEQHACLFFIEIKMPGKKPTPKQREMMKDLEEYGATCLVATCIEDLNNYI